jgi:hypothetical protein
MALNPIYINHQYNKLGRKGKQKRTSASCSTSQLLSCCRVRTAVSTESATDLGAGGGTIPFRTTETLRTEIQCGKWKRTYLKIQVLRDRGHEPTLH